VGGRPKRIVDRQKIWDMRAGGYSLGEISKQDAHTVLDGRQDLQGRGLSAATFP
jgi:hypothetical protein